MVFGLGKNLLFKSVLGHCDLSPRKTIKMILILFLPAMGRVIYNYHVTQAGRNRVKSSNILYLDKFSLTHYCCSTALW